MSTERQVADTLHEACVSVTLGSVEYGVPSPTLATLVEVSAIVSAFGDGRDEGSSLLEIIQSAGEAHLYADMLAVFILEAKRGNSKEREELARKLLEEAKVSEVIVAIQSIISMSDIGGLFMLTTSLREMRMTKPTREVVQEIASGQE